MTKSKFTKGPWKLQSDKIGIIDNTDTQSFGMMNAICHIDEYDLPEFKANAHLIAAAPDMYKFLSTMESDLRESLAEDAFDTQNEVEGATLNVEMIGDILAKARGE